MQKTISEYRRLFPVTEEYAYLNHAACSPLPRPGTDALARYWGEQGTKGVLSEPEYFPVVDYAREKMARLIGADSYEVGWVQNTASAMNLVANGLTWQRGDNVVTVQGEFPANVYPWLGLSGQGVETRFVQPRGNRIFVDDIAAALDSHTRLLTISFVEFSTGFRNNLYLLGQLCRERGILFNVDAIQGIGALRLNVHDAGIHFLGAGAHKWLLGPQGVGVIYVRHDMLERLRPLTSSWYSVADRHDYLAYGQPWVDAASRIEGSTHNVSGLVAFDAVLGLILEAGPGFIEERVLHLAGRLIDGLLSRGYDVVSSTHPDERSGVVCFRAKGDPAAIYARAVVEKMVIAVRVGVVRVSPHFYNSEEEIDRFLALL
ncbi:MAG: aminotransferase class V-fold PLP-dependent enzyme [Chloroflexi bacterium]|nr:aminotransferase class V-fold PLP-dependent enzyme [Chloroflexota bacterium]